MDDDLKGLVRTLREEKCPESVATQVAARLEREGRSSPPARGSFGRWAVAGGVALLLLWAGGGLRREPGDTSSQPVETVRSLQETQERMRVIQQAEGALALVGQALIHVATHTGDSLREEAATPLWKGFQSAKTKLTENL